MAASIFDLIILRFTREMEKSSLNYVQISKTPTEKLTLYQRF